MIEVTLVLSHVSCSGAETDAVIDMVEKRLLWLDLRIQASEQADAWRDETGATLEIRSYRLTTLVESKLTLALLKELAREAARLIGSPVLFQKREVEAEYIQ